MKDLQDVQHLVVCLIEKLICNFHFICHCSQSIPKAWPELVLAGYPRNMAWEMTILHSVYPLCSFIGNEAEVALIAS
jgi:hypothetical protein